MVQRSFSVALKAALDVPESLEKLLGFVATNAGQRLEDAQPLASFRFGTARLPGTVLMIEVGELFRGVE